MRDKPRDAGCAGGGPSGMSEDDKGATASLTAREKEQEGGEGSLKGGGRWTDHIGATASRTAQEPTAQ